MTCPCRHTGEEDAGYSSNRFATRVVTTTVRPLYPGKHYVPTVQVAGLVLRCRRKFTSLKLEQYNLQSIPHLFKSQLFNQEKYCRITSNYFAYTTSRKQFFRKKKFCQQIHLNVRKISWCFSQATCPLREMMMSKFSKFGKIWKKVRLQF